MIKLRAEDKRLTRKKKSYGSFMNWNAASMDTLGVMVCEKRESCIGLNK